MRCIPNLPVSAPMNEEELRNLMYTAQQEGMGPFVIRYPRGQGVMPDWRRAFQSINVGEGRKLCDGEEVALLSIGHIGNEVVNARMVLNEEGIFPAQDRTSVVSGKSVSVRVDLGGRSIIKKKKKI